MNIILFEDQQVSQLSPITTSKPAFAITCGTYRFIDLIQTWQRPTCYIVRNYLRAITTDDFPLSNEPLDLTSPIMLVNAALVPSLTTLKQLKEIGSSKQPMLFLSGERIAAAILPANQPPENRHLTHEMIGRYLQDLNIESCASELLLFEYPHDVIRYHLAIMTESLEHRLSTNNYQEIEKDVYLAEGATIGKYSVMDASEGPIILEANAKTGPYCYMIGPVYIGANSRVNEHAAIKDFVSLGHTTKIGGEVEASIIESYTNKQHHGFLGHSYLGSWINLGAGTCNSDLKNTYGEVNMEYGGQRIPSQMQFLGCIMGDYAKTAINTSIFTGKVIGVSSMLYGSITRNVPSFVNYARSFAQVTEIPAEVAISTQGRMFARRKVEQRPSDIQLLQDMYVETKHERQLGDEPLSL